MKTEVINKINITAEAVFDFEETLCLGRLDKRVLKAEVEDYIRFMNNSGRLIYDNYFRCKLFNEETDQMLILFVYRADKISIMQYWEIQGICLAEDWTEDDEYSGKIRNWVKSSITELDKSDWVVERELHKAANEVLGGWSVCGVISGLPKEIINAIQYGNNQEYAEAISSFQNSIGKRTWRKHFSRKTEVPRKRNKRIK